MKKEVLPIILLTGVLLAGCSSTSPSSEAPTQSGSVKTIPSPVPSKPQAKESNSSSNTNSLGSNNGGLLLGSIIDPMSSHQEHVITERFQQVQAYWERKRPNLAGIVATRLVVLKRDASFNCPTVTGEPHYVQASNPNDTQYCQSLGSIIITEGLASYIDTSPAGKNTDSVLEFFVDHEFGHALQAAEGTLKPGVATTEAMELQTDCYAGAAFEAIDPHHVAAVDRSFSIFPTDDNRHGPPLDRVASFIDGVGGSPC